MPTECIPYKETNYFTELILDYLDEKEELKTFYNRFPNLENFKAQIDEKSSFSLKNREILVKALKEQGALEVYACATHGIFSDPAITRISNCDDLKKVITTDTIPHPEYKQIEKIEVLSTADIFAKAIQRTFNHDSVSSLFV